jgi:hypothetical protein
MKFQFFGEVMKRKTHSNSSGAAVEAMQNAAKPIEVPAHISLRECDRPFWESILAGKPSDLWSASDLEDAASLARCKADIERLQAEIGAEGDVIDNRLNPKHALLETLTRRSLALSRTLQIHARARHGESRDQRPTHHTADNARAALRLVDDDDEDDLLARP